MTRLIVLSDVHGNAIALEAVRKAIAKERPDLVAVAGDLVLNGPDPSGAVDILREMEAAGAAIVSGNTEPLEPVSTVGSGDAFLAGYVAARYEGRSPEECLAYGVACGAESTQHFGAGTLDRREVERLLSRVELSELDVPAGVA